jgi:hypothetical protein
MLGWTLLFLLLLVGLSWDSFTKWTAMCRNVQALASRLVDVEEWHREAQTQMDGRDALEQMQRLNWRLTCRTAALQHRVEALTARLDMIEELAAEDPKVQTAVREFTSSFERSAVANIEAVRRTA